MTQTERENFYRNSTLIVDHTNESFTGLLQHDLTKQRLTLSQFIQAKQHEIYHLCYNNQPCCLCPPGSRAPVFRHNNRILNPAQLDILLDTTAKLPGQNPHCPTKHCCCPANPNINYDQLDLTLTRCLLLNFTTIIPDRSPERQAVDALMKFRNESYGHATSGKISDSDYQIYKAQIEKSIMVLAKAQGRESEFIQKLSDAAVRPLDETILRQYQTKLMENVEVMQTLKNIVSAVGVKSLPDYLTKDIEDVKVVEGCDARLEFWTTEGDINVEWFKGDKIIEMCEKYVVKTSRQIHSLVVTNTDLTDRGIYTAKFLDYTTSARLNIEEYYTKNMKTPVECIEGDDVELSCAVLEDNVTAVWEKDGVIVQKSAKYEIKDTGKSHTLSIIHLELNDAAEYSVKVNNRMRLTSLQVKEYFTKPLCTITCTEGETVQFECEVIDDHQTALWFKDNTIVITSDKYKVEKQGQIHRLVVSNTRFEDNGEYSVKIKTCVRQSELIVREMPTAIQHLSEEDKELYMDIIQSGTETRYYLRIVIIGENGVGKTCLLRRLLKQSTTGVQSTDGIDMHRCKICLRDGKWIFDEVSDNKKALLTRIKMASRSSTIDETFQEKAESLNASGLQDYDGSDNSNRESPYTSYNSSVTKRKTKTGIMRKIKNLFSRTKNKDQSFATISIRSEGSDVKMESHSKPKHNTITTLLTEKVLQGLNELLNGIEKVDVPADKFVECGILDFAGEKDYYATHPIFLNPNALHLLVTNIMKDVKPIKTEDGFNKIGGYVDFWLDTIHSCAVNEESKEEKEFVDPPAIIICTRIDQCKDHLHERKEEFHKQLLSVLRKEIKKKHVRDICYVSNTESGEEDFQDLRDTIFKYGKQVKTFAEKLPLRWIRLEQSLDVLREAELNILSWSDIVKLSSKCSIDSEDEINLFLKYQHKVGGVVYFESLKEYIILNQKWLANAFRCLVSDKFDPNLMLSDEWRVLVDTGKLEYSLIEKLFNKEPELDFNKHSGHLLNVMEIFGIIVKLTTLMENGQRTILPTYYMPCMISEKASFTDIIDRFNAKKDNCKRTPWLCIEFDFMPFDFFNHILCYYISQYTMCTEPQTGRMAIYHGMGVFFLDSTKFIKVCLCFCKNTIALQIWQWRNVKKGKCKEMLAELKVAIERVKERFETRKVSYTVKSKCFDGNIHLSAGRHSYSELMDLGDEYFCEEHSDSHNTTDFFHTWFKDYTENEGDVPAKLNLKSQEGIKDTRFKRKCHVCDKEPSVYWCHGCQRSMCQDCNNQHRKSTDTEDHIVQHVQDMYSLDYNFKVNVGWINDIKVLHDDVLVIAGGNQLVTCDITGQQQHTIPLPGGPWHIAVVDNNTVAVTLYTTTLSTTVVIVDVRQGQVIQHTDVKVLCHGIMYRDNQLFVGCEDRTIKVMNMSRKVTCTIPVGVIPYYICGGEAGRIYCTDYDKLYCIDTVGNTLFTFTDPNMSTPVGITTDDGGHVLVICKESNNVLRISPDGKQSQVIITQIPPSVYDPYICYNSLSKSVVIGCHDNVYVYKKV